MKTCETCRWWRDDRPRPYEGLCKRNAPKCLDDGSTDWPVTKHNDWCGEHQTKESKP